MVFNSTFNNTSIISWKSVFIVEETGVPGENHRLAASHWQTLSYNVVSTEYISPWTGFELTTLMVAQVVVNPTSMRARSRLPLSRQTQHILFFETQYLKKKKKKNLGASLQTKFQQQLTRRLHCTSFNDRSTKYVGLSLMSGELSLTQ